MELLIVLAIFVVLALIVGVTMIVLVAVVGVGVFAATKANKEARQAVKRVPATPIAQAVEGAEVKIIGRVGLAESPQVAPLTGRSCAYYSVVVEELSTGRPSFGGGGHRLSRWIELATEQAGAALTIDDGSGQAHVELSRVRLVVLKDTELRSHWEKDPSPQMQAFLQKHGIAGRTDLLGRAANLRYCEGVLEPGETVAAVGIAHWEEIPSDDGAPPSRRLTVVAPQSGQLLVTDDPKLF